MNIISAFGRPESLFRPRQLWSRIRCELRPPQLFETVRLPWRLPLQIRPAESQGSSIRRLGLHDLPTSECIWRLLDAGDHAVDVGANIGHMTGLMAVKVGSHGTVCAFEPHPQLYQELEANVDAWQACKHLAPIVTRRLAATDHSGTAELIVPLEFESNRGLCSLSSPAKSGGLVTPVEVGRLDRLLPEGATIGLLKIDVEGHELQVLGGAADLLSPARIRDIVFEEHLPPPTPVTDLLEHRGYHIFYLGHTILGPRLEPMRTRRKRVLKDAPNYLATIDPDRARARMRGMGWRVLRCKIR